MQLLGSFETIAEIAITLAGLTGVVVALVFPRVRAADDGAEPTR